MTAAKPSTEPTGNQLLDLLPRADGDRLRSHLEAVSMGVKHVVYEPLGPISHVYFPIGAVISLVTYMEDGTAVEVATIEARRRGHVVIERALPDGSIRLAIGMGE